MKRTIIFTSVVACGLALLLYPEAARYVGGWMDHHHGEQYEDVASHVTYTVRTDLIDAAHDYNERLNERSVDVRAADALTDADYQAQLHIGGTEAIGEVVIPSLELVLPIYHGSLEGELEEGAGHVYGTSLPVGGPSTHTVIAAHAALTGADRFHDLHEMEVGDDFYLVVLGQKMRYIVDQITVVLPTDLEQVQVIPGEDHATLLTCTPLGINSHRLLVRGVRGPDLPLLTTSVHPGFPWWAAWFVGGVVLAAILARLVTRRMTGHGEHRGHTEGLVTGHGEHRGHLAPVAASHAAAVAHAGGAHAAGVHGGTHAAPGGHGHAGSFWHPVHGGHSHASDDGAPAGGAAPAPAPAPAPSDVDTTGGEAS